MRSKGGETKQEVKLPKELMDAAKQNLVLANQVARLPPMHNFGGTVAAFTPQQVAGMAASDAAAASLGMPTAGFNTGMNIPGMPQAQNFGGIQAYSTKDVYDDAMARVPPEIKAAYYQFLSTNITNQPVAGVNGAGVTAATNPVGQLTAPALVSGITGSGGGKPEDVKAWLRYLQGGSK